MTRIETRAQTFCFFPPPSPFCPAGSFHHVAVFFAPLDPFLTSLSLLSYFRLLLLLLSIFACTFFPFCDPFPPMFLLGDAMQAFPRPLMMSFQGLCVCIKLLFSFLFTSFIRPPSLFSPIFLSCLRHVPGRAIEGDFGRQSCEGLLF